MLVDTNKTITMRRFRMIPTKRAIKGLRVGVLMDMENNGMQET
jgi:hypothetical protein